MYRILVPLDGSLHAERALPWADALARPLNAAISLVSVVPASDPTFPLDAIEDADEIDVLEHEDSDAQRYLIEVAGRLAEERPDAPPPEWELIGGSSGKAIAEVARI